MPEQVVTKRSRGFVCVNAHPEGCARNVERQIEHVRGGAGAAAGIRNVLVVGCSTGYGLATRIASGWGLGSRTLGVCLERPPVGRRTATAGYYNCAAVHRAAERDGLWARTVNADAFSDEAKDEVARIVADDMGQLDLVVYSLAAPKRTNPRTGASRASSLKAIGSPYTGKTVDLSTSEVTLATVEPASKAEIDDTVAVMGGEDWTWWIERLADDDLLAEGFRTVAYSYLGPRLTWPIYRDGTIGAAKRDLASRAASLYRSLAESVRGSAWVSVNKAVVTQASAAIPVVPLYISVLFRVMKSKGIHEGCIEQMQRLLLDHIGAPEGPVLDRDGLIRLDDLEMRKDVQSAVAAAWERVDSDTLHEFADYAGFQREFSNLFGFDVEGVDYSLPVETEVSWDA